MQQVWIKLEIQSGNVLVKRIVKLKISEDQQDREYWKRQAIQF